MDLFRGSALFISSRLCLVVSVIFIVTIGYYNGLLALGGVALLGVVYYLSLSQRKQQQWALESYLKELKQVMKDSVRMALHGLPQGILIVDQDGRVHWWNELMNDWSDGRVAENQDLKELIPEFPLEQFLTTPGKWKFVDKEKTYRVEARPVGESGGVNTYLALYIADVSDFQARMDKAFLAQPVTAHIQIDNYSEVLQGMQDEGRTELLTEANRKISAWVSSHKGVLRKVSEDSYIAFFDRRALEDIRLEKVDILDEIRELEGMNKLPVTLSLGIATGEESLMALNDRAQAALDLALGRGGDQAVVHLDGQTQFFGGKSKAVEKFTRVKARVVAQAIKELIGGADKVIVMGHRAEDYDSLGAAMGVARLSFALGKTAHVVLSSKSPNMEQLRTRMNISRDGMQDYFLSGNEAVELLTPNTLVIVVDTHRPDSVAAPEILEAADKVIVIDHHRRTENFIANPLLIYLEPSTSSTCELVTELITYLDERVKLTPFEVAMLFAGIVLDTKNFIIQTGSRTLEAASFLRRSGADPQTVQRLFWMDVESLKNRASLITQMEIFEDVYAISHYSGVEKDATIISSQAADMMSALLGVKASFVLYQEDEHTIGISARSQGEVSVQLIMERLGGGGHQMSAATQLEDTSMKEAEDKLREAIRQYEAE